MRGLSEPALLFCFLWILLFILYYPAAKAGFVADFTGWLDQVRNHPFGEYINRTNFKAKSLYQFTQFNTYVLYKLFGVNAWAWHILFISLHALNGVLLFVLCRRMLGDTGLQKITSIALAGATLFCVSAYMTEAIVWEPSFHFLQGLLLILLVLLCVQRYVHTGNLKYAWITSFVYVLSLFSLEVFYITPWLVLTLAVFYQYVLPGRSALKNVTRFFFLPLLLLSAARFAVYKLYAGDWVSRIGSDVVSGVTLQSFGKPAKYLFHLLFLGRYLPDHARNLGYRFCDSFTGICITYATILLVLIQITRKFRKMSGKAKVASVLFVWMLLALLLFVPLWFPNDMLVVFDRYTYFSGAFFYMLLPVMIYFIPVKYIRWAVVAAFAGANLLFLMQAIRYWNKSEQVVSGLLHNIPDDRSKTMLLLNLPQTMQGVPMIGAEHNSEFKLMHDLLIPGKPLTNTVYDVLAYNMLTPIDGAHVYVVNDSTVKVTLNQWGTWWWFGMKGAEGYWTNDFKLNLVDPGHWYELTLRKPADQFLLLYSVGDQWKTVDMKKQGVDQN